MRAVGWKKQGKGYVRLLEGHHLEIKPHGEQWALYCDGVRVGHCPSMVAASQAARAYLRQPTTAGPKLETK